MEKSYFDWERFKSACKKRGFRNIETFVEKYCDVYKTSTYTGKNFKQKILDEEGKALSHIMINICRLLNVDPNYLNGKEMEKFSEQSVFSTPNGFPNLPEGYFIDDENNIVPYYFTDHDLRKEETVAALKKIIMNECFSSFNLSDSCELSDRQISWIDSNCNELLDCTVSFLNNVITQCSFESILNNYDNENDNELPADISNVDISFTVTIDKK